MGFILLSIDITPTILRVYFKLCHYMNFLRLIGKAADVIVTNGLNLLFSKGGGAIVRNVRCFLHSIYI